ncbi:MAG: hypothetical protein KBD31_05185 [Proteobacteria bacterium]|nr:hypothetical protein [Pseudomonadota bacterium]
MHENCYGMPQFYKLSKCKKIIEQSKTFAADASKLIHISPDTACNVIIKTISPHFYEKAKWLNLCANNNPKAYPMGWNLAITLGIHDYLEYMKELGEKTTQNLSYALQILSAKLLVELINAGTEVKDEE